MKSLLPPLVMSFAVATASVGVSSRGSAAESRPGTQKASSANAAIMAYLGDPVPPPAGVDPRYTPEGLAEAFKSLCNKVGFDVQRLAVDETEYPFLVYGVIEGRHDFREIQAGLRAMSGYAYGGSVVGHTREGSTYFSLSMMPTGQYPSGQVEAIRRRLMIRLQMLAAIWTDPK